MAELQDAVPLPPVRRDRSVEARRDARLKKDARERRIVDLLDRGVSMAELAVREGVTLRGMQMLVKTTLARRGPAAPAEYLALQVSRLNGAMIVAYGSMANGNLDAVDRVVRLVKEMDRFHGFFPSRGADPISQVRLTQLTGASLALAAPVDEGCDGEPEKAPHSVEDAQNAEGNGAPFAWRSRESGPTKPRRTAAGPMESPLAFEALTIRPEMAPHSVENAQNAEGNGAPFARRSRESGPTKPRRTADGPMQSPLALDALTIRPEKAPQAIDNARFAEGNGAPSLGGAVRTAPVFDGPLRSGSGRRRSIGVARGQDAGAEHIADAAHRTDERPGGVDIDLLA